ncbi:FabD/lysophospholipase-like protein [Mycena sanguinolenta]|uniref:FabD/lysophospholipase-like protein n=1 Tax=Mycena sanguinolenta TaxID=230812 RepID=A0A8H7CLZ7_9AGAR|nr:FabD/lysophospholipase-like protein [Mycena sanguinolenta]
MEPPAMTEMSQQIPILTLSQQLEGTMLAEHQSRPMQLSITGGQGGTGGLGHPQGIGGVGGTGMGPTVNITAQQLTLSTLASEQVSQESKIRAAQIGIRCPPPSRIFQGRRDILDQMHDFFTSNTGVQKIFLLHGLGGAGKTQIALKFIKEFSVNFSDVFFIDTSSIATIDAGLKSIAVIKNFGDSLQEGLLWLTSQVQAWLLVFDNADDPRINLQEFIPECDHGNIIITSRNPGLSIHAGSESSVSDMEEQDAVILLLKSAAQMVTVATKQIAAEIVQALFYLPLAIIQAGAFISKSRNLSSYLELYTKNQEQLLREKPTQSRDRYKWTVYTTWQMSFDQLSPPAAMLLQHCSFLHYNGISEQIFSYAAQYQSSSDGPSEEELQEPLEFLSQFRRSMGEWDSLKFTLAMNEVQAYSLVGFDEVTKLFSVHPLVHTWGQISNPNPDKYMLTIGNILGMALSQRSQGDSGLPSPVLYPHIELALQNSLDLAPTFRHCYGLLYREAGKYKESANILEAVLGDRKQLLGDEHRDTLITMTQLAYTISCLGEYQRAKDLETTVLEKQKQILGDSHPDMMVTMNNLATTYIELGEYQNAKDLKITVLEKEKQILGDNHPHTLFAMSNLASIYSALGEYQKAKDLEIAVLEKRKQILGDDHLDTLRAKANLASTYSDFGKHQEAKELEIVVLEKRKQILGSNHPHTLLAMANLAITYSELGEYQEARDFEIVVLEQRKQILGNNHPATLLAMGNLASTYSNLGEYPKAKDLKITVLEKQKQILGDNHPHTLLAMSNLASTYSDLGEYQKAQDLEIAVLEKRKQILGHDHPDTLRAMRNLALTYSDLGEHQNAQVLEIAVLEKRKQILGNDHPHTLLAMASLASTYSELGEYQEAKHLEIAVLEKQKQILGVNHLDTLLAMGNLARTYSNLGEHQEAKDLEIAVLEKRKQIMGDNNPDTLLAMANLATTYWHLEDYQKAKELEIIVLEKRKQILGDTHPDTLHAISNLAFTYSDLGEHQQAQELRELVHQAEIASNPG